MGDTVRNTISWALHHLPRPLLQRAVRIVLPVMGIAYRGNGRYCPVCGKRSRKFLPYGYGPMREDALCPQCLSLERHRELWLYLTSEKHILDYRPRILHIAPEECLMGKFRHHYRENKDLYVTADLESPLAQMHFDVQQIPLEDGSFDIVICNHILEHVANDRKAMREICRVLRSGGYAVILSPVDRTRECTFEDPSITTPEGRAQAFGQYDHLRIYGRDYPKRLEEEGFRVESIDFSDMVDDNERKEMSLGSDTLYIAYK